MKRLLFISLLCSCSLFASTPTKDDIDNLVQQIKPPRAGASNKIISNIENPFILIKVSKDKKGNVIKVVPKIRRSYSRSSSKYVRSFKLYATLNKSAKINHKWIPLNGKISGYTLKIVTKHYVTLQKGTAKPVTVYLNKKNKNINLLTK